jgi:hypothetical protein
MSKCGEVRFRDATYIINDVRGLVDGIRAKLVL